MATIRGIRVPFHALLLATGLLACHKVSIQSPAHNGAVDNPVKFHIAYPAVKPGSMKIALDGNDVTPQFTIARTSATSNFEVMPGSHSLNVSGDFADTGSSNYSADSVSSTFHLGGFGIQPPPMIGLDASKPTSVDVIVVRAPSFTGDVTLSLAPLPGGITTDTESVVVPASKDRATIVFRFPEGKKGGVFPITFHGKGDDITHSVTASMIVGPLPDDMKSTWNDVYAAFFAAGTAGHCADCHGGTGIGGFKVGNDAKSFLDGMKAKGLVDAANPMASRLGDPARSPLRWMNPNGQMPDNQGEPNDAARFQIQAWLAEWARHPATP
jgi:hypothetical protein